MSATLQQYLPDQDGMERFVQCHQSQLKLAGLLEEVANRLPNIEPLMVRRARDILLFDLPIHAADRLRGLYPLLGERCRGDQTVTAILAELAIETREREPRCDDAVNLLSAMLGEGRDYRGPEAAGYQLRAFFEGLARQLNWEQKLLLPLADQHLDLRDRTDLWHCMEENRRVQSVAV
jgi:hypothetical protein